MTPTATVTPTPTVTRTRTATRTATPTFPVSAGPQITFFGVVTAFNTVLMPDNVDGAGNPVYTRPAGGGFFLVVEAKAGTDLSAPGRKMQNGDPSNPMVRPDLQIEASRNLGNGSATVCDVAGQGVSIPPGGVPGFNPFNFDPNSQAVADALNDVGCRFDVHDDSEPCTLNASGNFHFVAPDTALQYCTASVVGAEWEFPTGDTTVIAQVRDTGGTIGFPRMLVVRVR